LNHKFESQNSKYNKSDENLIKDIKAKNVHLMKPDKGKGVVIMDKDDYEERMLKALGDGPYKQMKIDGRWKDGSPINKMEQDVLSLMKTLKTDYGLKQATYRSLIVSNPKMPVMYGLPKIHKVGNKMRPIISNVKAPTSKMSKYVVRKFEEMKYPKGMNVKNSIELVDILKDVKI
jgi:hypothetical protein